VIERLVDVAAHEIGIAPTSCRRKNFTQGALPYTPSDRQELRVGRLRDHLRREQETAEWKRIERR